MQDLFEKTIKDYRHEIIDTRGEEYLVVFASPTESVQFALKIQGALRAAREQMPDLCRMRIGIGGGEVQVTEAGKRRRVIGTRVNETGRYCSLARGGQIICSRYVFDNARAFLEGETLGGDAPQFIYHGQFVPQGLELPQDVCEVWHPALEAKQAPARGKGEWVGHPEEELGWRPAVNDRVPESDWVLKKKLGEGEFGEVWLALHEGENTSAALKFCFKRSRIAWLKRQARILDELNERLPQHKALVRYKKTLMITAERPPYYIAMEYVEGPDIAEWLKTDPPLKARLEVIAQVANALDGVHRAGVYHRDVKPDNILLQRRPEGGVDAKLSDFGLATATDEAIRARLRSALLETVDRQVGAVDYMAPELLEEPPKPADGRTDVYALGVTLYQVVSGKLEQRMAHGWERDVHDPVLREDIKDCVDPDPDKRPTAQELANRLERHDIRVLEREAVAERERQRQRNRRLASYMTAILIMATVAVGGLYAWDYYRTKTVYYTDYVEQWSVPQGIAELDELQIAGREYHYRFEYSQRKLQRVIHANSAGTPMPETDSERADRPMIMTLTFGADGDLLERTYLGLNNRVLLRQKIEQRPGHDEYFIDFRDETSGGMALAASTTSDEHGALDSSKSGVSGGVPERSSISRYAILADADGFAQEFHYLRDSYNTPVPDGDGIFGLRFERDSFHRLTEALYLDQDAETTTNKTGIAGKRYRYDAYGNLVSVEWLNSDRQPWLNNMNYAKETRTFDQRGNEIERAYKGVDGEPVLINDGYAKYTSEFDERGYEVERVYFDVDGAPAFIKEGYAKFTSKFNERGNEIERAFFGVDGEPVLDTNGVASWTSEFDERGNVTETAYFGTDGKPVLHKDGYAKRNYEFDDRGNNYQITFFGVDGEPTQNVQGVHKYSVQYDEHDNEIEMTFFGTRGEPVYFEGVEHRHTHKYDERRNRIETAYFGVDGEPVLTKDGYAKFTDKFDERGNLIEEAYFGVDGEPVLTKDGYAKFTDKFDERGNLIEEAYFGVDGEPVLHKEGIAGWTSKFNERGNEVERAFFGIDGEPVLLVYGYAKWTSKFDERGNEIETAFFGTDGEPVLDAGGFVKQTKKFDERGNKTETAYYGTDGKPVLSKDGYAGFTTKFDDLGNVVESAVFGIDGEPVLMKEGYTGWTSKFDERGNEIERAFFGVDVEPVLIASGYAGWTGKFDEWGNEIQSAYFGIDGEPVLITAGYAKSTSKFDERRNRIESAYFGIDGEPVLITAG
ncbi:MAG: protein kinase, partial [Candidatus Hydrogenedentes bacterium]|nr:protein kinase [Candidatus Hydrogenedentota bacterium]